MREDKIAKTPGNYCPLCNNYALDLYATVKRAKGSFQVHIDMRDWDKWEGICKKCWNNILEEYKIK